MLKKGTRVIVAAGDNTYIGVNGHLGTIKYVPSVNGGKYAVNIDNAINTNSKYGWFYFKERNLIELPTFTVYTIPSIRKVYFNDPVTVVIWDDGSKTVVKCQIQTGDSYSKETGLAMCIAKKAMGNKGNYYDVFKKWVYEDC